MTDETATRIERLTVAVGMVPAATEALAIAVRLAARLGARLDALFVQEDTLVRLAEMPLARRVRFPTGEVEAIDRSAVMAEFATQEQRLRAAIAAGARASGVEWRFQRLGPQAPCEACEVLVMAASFLELRSGSAFATLAHRASGLLLLPPRGLAARPRPPASAARAAAEGGKRPAFAEAARAVLAEWGLQPRQPREAEAPAESPSEPGITFPGIGTLSMREISELLDRLRDPLLLTR